MAPWSWLPGTAGLCECECSRGPPGVLSHLLRAAPGQEDRDIRREPKVRPRCRTCPKLAGATVESAAAEAGWEDSERLPRRRPRQPSPGITHTCCCPGRSRRVPFTRRRHQAPSGEAAQWSRRPGWRGDLDLSRGGPLSGIAVSGLRSLPWPTHVITILEATRGSQ